jgi:outer membrane cobalamin receptor
MGPHSRSQVARLRYAYLAGCAAVLLVSAPAFAASANNEAPTGQETPPVTQPSDDQPQKDIVVTGSLVRSTGFTAPTPVTVIDADALARVAAPNVADAINQMPALRPSLTPTSAVNAGGGTQIGGNYLDLRGLGYARTLVLLDGRRYVPSNPTGAVNLNNIPQALIDRRGWCRQPADQGESGRPQGDPASRRGGSGRLPQRADLGGRWGQADRQHASGIGR